MNTSFRNRLDRFIDRRRCGKRPARSLRLFLGLVISVALPALAQTLPTAFTANTVFVDGKWGTPSGQRERSDFPFQTLAQAIAAASPGDTIEMRPGSYTPGAGRLTIATDNLTIRAYGVKYSASSGTDYGKLVLSGNGITLEGMEIDGKYSTGNDPNVGMIEVSGADCKLYDLYIHDYASQNIRTLAGSHRLKVHHCRLVNGFNGIATTNYSTATVYGMEFTENTIENCRKDGISHDSEGWSASGNAIVGTVISKNILRNNAIVGVEAFGGFMDGLTISDNYIANSQYGISVAPATHTIVANNLVKAGSYCGIEFADTPDNSGNVASNNLIDCLNESGVYTGATGYAISSQSGNHNSQLSIIGGAVVNTGVGGGGSGGGGIAMSNHDSVYIRGVYIYGGGTPIQISYCNNVTVEGVRADSTTSDGHNYFIWTSAASGSTLTGFHYRNNQFRRTAITSGYAPFAFYHTPSSPATFNDAHIEFNTTNQTFGGSGYQDNGGNTVNATSIGNYPNTNVYGNGQYGFADSARFYSASITDGITVGDGHPNAATATPGYIDLGSSFSNSAGNHLKLVLYDGGDMGGVNSYGLGISSSQMDFNVPTGASYNFYVNGALKFGIKGANTTGTGTASLGANSPAINNVAPYTWIQVTTADGSTGYIPVWK